MKIIFENVEVLAVSAGVSKKGNEYCSIKIQDNNNGKKGLQYKLLATGDFVDRARCINEKNIISCECKANINIVDGKLILDGFYITEL